jgi:hypothetical protein
VLQGFERFYLILLNFAIFESGYWRTRIIAKKFSTKWAAKKAMRRMERDSGGDPIARLGY